MDGLIGLLNKRAMLEVADQKIGSAKRFGKQLSVLVTDIDHFKKVNDTHGHDVGDVVIKGLGEILRRLERNTDAVARFGGEELMYRSTAWSPSMNKAGVKALPAA